LGDLPRAILRPITGRPSANFINAAKKPGSNAVSHCQFVPEIVQCAVNVFTYKSINQFDPSQVQSTSLQPAAIIGSGHLLLLVCFPRPETHSRMSWCRGTIECRHKTIGKNGRPRNSKREWDAKNFGRSENPKLNRRKNFTKRLN
jgi:hypothetical protein